MGPLAPKTIETATVTIHHRQNTAPALGTAEALPTYGAEKLSFERSHAMRGDEYYRRQAQDAELQAQRALSPVDRASWLRIAQGWLSLIGRKPANSEVDAFDDAVARHGTHQDVSDEAQ
jgi:hypothetical protein